jgi:hypothetical protein
LDCLDVRPGTQLANIGNMPHVQLSPALRNAFRAALNRAPKKSKGGLAIGLALALVAAVIFFWLGPQRQFQFAALLVQM